MYNGVSADFINKARKGVLRGIVVAGVFLAFQYIPEWWEYIRYDWVFLPLIFLLISLPFSWQKFGYLIIIPLIISVWTWFVFAFIEYSSISFLWSPFHEEIGKWYQSVTISYPAIMSPFVSLGFAFLENFRYFSFDITWPQILGRTLFSLPLHIFVGLFAFWIFFSLRSRILGVTLWLLAAIAIHTLYNWSLNTSLLITLFIIICGYMFYWWSLGEWWWKKSI